MMTALWFVAPSALSQATPAALCFVLPGDSQPFSATLGKGANGCSDCVELNFIGTNSWESYTSTLGNTLTLYDGHGCTGDKALHN